LMKVLRFGFLLGTSSGIVPLLFRVHGSWLRVQS